GVPGEQLERDAGVALVGVAEQVVEPHAVGGAVVEVQHQRGEALGGGVAARDLGAVGDEGVLLLERRHVISCSLGVGEAGAAVAFVGDGVERAGN
ncbi:hypothetical protein RZS08_29650, partial [Arthrospira platensis SPKY1]|nr:hypothetical protein [Arthrospira platensis SPKY1]